MSCVSLPGSNRYFALRLCAAYKKTSLEFRLISVYVFSGLLSPVDGILPAQIDAINGAHIHEKVLSFIDRPNWIRILKLCGLATFPSIEIISLLGIVVSFFGFVTRRFCILPSFALLWSLYYSLVDVSQAFHQQSDDLLLEAGLVCILLAPGLSSFKYGVSDNVMLMLMRWVLFR